MHVRKNQSLAAWLTATTLVMSGATHASLVSNGGFETSDFTGWTQFGDTSFSGVDGAMPQAGVFAAYFGPPSASGGIFQTLATTSGFHYNVSFWLKNEADPFGSVTPNSFEFNWDGGAAEVAQVNQPSFGYTEYSVSNLIASSAATDLRFTFFHGPAFWDLDSVSATVPEPGSLALVGLAGLLASLVSRRRQA